MNKTRIRKQSRRRRSNRQTSLSLYSRNFGDTTKFRLHGAIQVSNTSSGTNNGLIQVSPTGPGITLTNFVPNLVNLSASFTKYMVTRLVVRYDPTLPTTIGAFWAAAYEPRTQGATAPTTIADATQGAHSISGNQIQGKTMTFSPSAYYNDWKSVTVEADLDDSACGVLQTFSKNMGLATDGVGIMTIDFDIVFTGLV
jgi:hypothetical protein